jgi:hypothetical protein
MLPCALILILSRAAHFSLLRPLLYPYSWLMNMFSSVKNTEAMQNKLPQIVATVSTCIIRI